MRPPLLLLLLSIQVSSAAISVTGISDETNYSGSRSFTVDEPAGFVTTATLNGASIAVGTEVTANDSGFYELVVTETSGAGSNEATFLFNIREPGRGSTETGLPAFTAVPLVNDAPSAVDTGALQLVTPNAFPDDLPIPAIGLLQKTNGDPLWLNTRVRITDHPASTIQLRRGFGYSFLPAATTTAGSTTASLSVAAPIRIEDSSIAYTALSGSITSDMTFADNARINVTGDLIVDAGVTLTIGAGGVVRIAPDADIHVDGNFVVNATPADPTTFAPTTHGSAWGGFFLQETTSNVDITGAILYGSGADQTWFDTNAGFASHRDEQALFLVGPAGSQLDLTDCYLIENTGQILHNDEGGDVTLTRCLLQGATTCGELTGGTLTVDQSALLLFPDENPNFADGDNDAIYLTSGQHMFTNTVIGYTQDDGIDTGGSPNGYTTNTSAQGCWFESILHEGMSNSGQKNVSAVDTVFFNCGQTIECGYDGPQSTMLRCLSVANMVGVRFGDNYDWDYADNHLTVTDSLLLNNLFHDIWGYDWSSWTYNTAKMTVSGNKMTIAGDLARHPGDNSAFDPGSDSALISPYMPVPGSDVGIAITSAPSQAAIADYPQAFSVQLSTFSSNIVTTDYELTGRATLESPDVTLLSGTLSFDPGQTNQTLDLPLPAGSFALVRLSLGNSTNAADTGGEAWFLDSSAIPSPTLIARGSDWKYNAERAEPATGWKGDQAFDDSAWSSGPTPIGYGDGDEQTVLTAAEHGPNDDRTTAVYFRREFQVADPTAVTALTLNLQRDDGAIVYLNGVEIARSNMDPGAVAYATLADNASNENDYVEILLPASALTNLQAGSNLLAVEVHQSSLTSSDLSFDLDLIATQTSQQVDLLRSNADAFIFWSEPAGILQESGDLLDWISTDATSPFPVTTDEARKFYRILYP